MESIKENGDDERREIRPLVRQLSGITLPRSTVVGFGAFVFLWLLYMTAGFLWLYWEHVRLQAKTAPTPPEAELETEIITRMSAAGRVAAKAFRRFLDSVPFVAVFVGVIFDNAWMASSAEKVGMLLGTVWTTVAPLFTKVAVGAAAADCLTVSLIVPEQIPDPPFPAFYTESGALCGCREKLEACDGHVARIFEEASQGSLQSTASPPVRDKARRRGRNRSSCGLIRSRSPAAHVVFLDSEDKRGGKGCFDVRASEDKISQLVSCEG
mmetsp:Transcript_18960/g.71754  ORF Transcript_18960/g.71754 Transcript_18960/m.71754 type:complete len:268 (+) Transcript_18960:237-1040(+)